MRQPKNTKRYPNEASLLRRLRHSLEEESSQSEIAWKLGFKNGQYISNCERTLCQLPWKSWEKVIQLYGEKAGVGWNEVLSAINADTAFNIEKFKNRNS